jgi:conjugal transfer ATP-binding protein TraC
MKVGHEFVGMYALSSEKEFPPSLEAKYKDPEYSSRSFSFYKGLGDHFGLSLCFSHIYTQILCIDNPTYWIGQLEKKCQSLAKLQKFSTSLKAQYENLKAIVSKFSKSEEDLHFVRAHFNVLFWNSHRETFLKHSHQISTIFKSLDLQASEICSKELGHLFFNSHFALSANLSNPYFSLLPLKSALCLFSSVTNYKNDPQGLFFNDRIENIPIKKDIWDEAKKRIKARNFALFAPTGEGKSVLANHLIRQYLDQGYKVVIIDLGGSYEKLCHLYPKQSLYFKFEERQALTYNPFFIEDSKELSSAKIESLVEFILIHFQKESSASQTYKIALKKILLFYFKQEVKDSKEASFPHFIDFVNKNSKKIASSCELAQEHFDFNSFKHLSSEFTPGGTYSFLYEDKKARQIDFRDKSLIIADLDVIKENAFLLSIYLSMLHQAIETNIWQDKTKRGIVLYDEFAKQLQFNEVLNRVIYFAQAIRKQNGELGIILQSINQLPDKPEVRSMIENIQVIYCLKNTKGYKDLYERLNLNTHQHYQLQSLRNNFLGSRKYSEFWMLLGNQSNVYRLELPPEALYAYLSEGEENKKIMDLFEKTKDMQKAISQYKTH